jgi:hypothetical protein
MSHELLFCLIVLFVLIALFANHRHGEFYQDDSNCAIPGSCQDRCHAELLELFQPIVKEFNCTDYKLIRNALPLTNRFTLSVIIEMGNYEQDGSYQRLFNGGDYHSRRKTPGVWVRNGYLHVRATSDRTSNDGGKRCAVIRPQLKENSYHHLVLVFDQRKINVYLDGKLAETCPTVGTIIPFRDLHLGAYSPQGKGKGTPGLDARLTIGFLPRTVSEEEIKRCGELLRLQTREYRFSKRAEYLGCMGRNYLDNGPTKFPRMISQQCVNHCRKLSYDYAGIMNGNECWCGMYPEKGFGRRISGRNCLVKCSGNRSLNCGGRGRSHLYYVGPDLKQRLTFSRDPIERHLGCFGVRSRRAMRHVVRQDKMTPQKCIDYCQKRRFRYAGTKDGTYCSCGNGPDLGPRLELSNCEQPCSGSMTNFCGSEESQNIYDARPGVLPKATP